MAGRHRNPHLEAAIISAGTTLLRAAGYRAFSIERVAHAVGIPRSTIYTRWSTRADLLDDLLSRLMSTVPPADADVRLALIQLLTDDLAIASSADGRAIAQLLLASQDPNGPAADRVHDQLSHRRQQYLDVLTRGGGAGVGAAAAVDVTLLAVWGRSLLATDVLPPTPEGLADLILGFA